MTQYKLKKEMEKKTYIKPTVKGMQLNAQHHLAAGSNPFSNDWNSRRANDIADWDDEEEETEDSMWK